MFWQNPAKKLNNKSLYESHRIRHFCPSLH